MNGRSEEELRKSIEDFYLPRQLVDAIFQNGEIPSRSVVRTVGIGFMDIADYAYLSRFLSPAENQALLNGLYTAFNSVLRRYGGYLNKIEGDSLMFHYGGPVDPETRELDDADAAPDVARKLFRSCVEMQRVCVQFNRADDRFLTHQATPQDKEMLDQAFAVMDEIRNQSEISQSLSAFFQVQIRIGAHIGQVTVGNFGPVGARQWDVIGEPVIKAKRMEQTAPVGGLRISNELHDQLVASGTLDEYFQEFRRQAQEVNGYYQEITKEELFQAKTVTIAEKRNAQFNTCTVQIHPDQPESVARQVSLLCERGEQGVSRALDIIRYHRGNPFIVQAIEDRLYSMGVGLRKSPMIQAILPRTYRKLVNEGMSEERIDREINARFSLFDIFKRLGEYQDALKRESSDDFELGAFSSYEQYIRQSRELIERQYERRKRKAIQHSYFHDVVFPTVLESLRAGILEYYYLSRELEVVESA